MFIVIEGIDGAGCETQAKLVADKLQKTGKMVSLIKYPNYSSPIGQMIKKFLYENEVLTAQEQFLLYSLQFVFDAQFIKKETEKGFLVADRYFTSTLCYQILEGVEEKTALRFAVDFGIIKPDFVFYLDVAPPVAAKRKFGENKILNFREKDFQFIEKTYAKYDDLVKRDVWTKWERINGEREPDVIAEEIVNKIKT